MTKQVKQANRKRPSPETFEMARRLAACLNVEGMSTKILYEHLWTNLELLEEKLRERFYQEQWERGLSGRN